jgi:Zn-dependent protease
MFGASRHTDNPINWSFAIGRMFDIRIKLHLFFLIFAGLYIIQYAVEGQIFFGLGVTVILFSIVLLHEFGHCFGARYAGGEADEILLWPLGGLAYTRPPHTAGGHLVTTLAGPLVNVVICGATATSLIIGDPDHALAAVPWNPFEPVFIGSLLNPWFWVSEVSRISYILLLFNLVPMYPLDGGRVVQEVLWFKLGYRRSSMIACTTGMVGAIGLGCIAFFAKDNAFLLLGVAVFGYLTCWRQKMMLRAGEMETTSEFGYDFSQGYTSLGRSIGADDPPRRPSWFARRRQAKEERRRQREAEREAANERKLDELLDKVHRDGLHSLTAAERRFLEEASAKRR